VEIFIESPDIIHQHVYYNWNLIKADPDDNKFFDIAVAANADYLVPMMRTLTL
jgi:predicted nucleic acid-binding protein